MLDLIYLVIIAIVVSLLSTYFFRRKSPGVKDVQLAKKLTESQQVFGDLSEHLGHSFQNVELFSKPTYSSSSGNPLLSGLCCDKCGICIATDERKQAISYLKCKPLFIDDVVGGTSSNVGSNNNNNNSNNDAGETNEEGGCSDEEVGTPRDHHLVVGNLPLLSVCSVCKTAAGHEPRLVDYFCSLCHRAVHDKCLGLFLAAMSTRFCDLGIFARFSVPPWSVRVRRITQVSASRLLKGKVAAKISLTRICIPPALRDQPQQWQPIFIFANRQSGNSDAEMILHAFRLHLNPVCQIFDLSIHRDPVAILTAINDHLPTGISFIALTAGGDGTVRWIANSLCQLKDAFASRQRNPQIAILPLGTGNDLAQALGLGSGHVGSLDVVDYVEKTLSKCKSVKLDRWQIDIGTMSDSLPSVQQVAQPPESPPLTRNTRTTSRLAAIRSWRPHLPILAPKSSIQSHYMYNYISIGADASVTLSFAQRRDSTPWLCNSRLTNKLIYGLYGLVDMFQRECHDLYNQVKLQLDDRVITELPKIEALIFLNISSWGGGCRLLELGSDDSAENDAAKFNEQKFDDGVIEVVGVYSSMHMAQLFSGFGSPVRIGQAKRVTLDLLKRFPVQVDGEAWKQSPCRITINRCGQVDILACEASEAQNE